MGASSPSPSGGGITKLSELIIDADKDWGTNGIANVKETTLGMVKGDMNQKNGVLIKLSPTNHGDELTSRGVGNEVAFLAPPVM